jgi:hypothetical protein
MALTPITCQLHASRRFTQSFCWSLIVVVSAGKWGLVDILNP